MHHKKVKTQPCLSPESPFTRKPSKQFLHKFSFNKNKFKQNQNTIKQDSIPLLKSEISKISFIPTGINGNILLPKNQPNKLKKTTVQLGTFKIKHENMLLKNELQQVKMQNVKLSRQNQQLKKQNQLLNKQLQKYYFSTSLSKLSKNSQSTDQRTISFDRNVQNIRSLQVKSQQILQINSYDLLNNTLNVSKANSLTYLEQQVAPYEELNFLSTSLSRKFQPQAINTKMQSKKSTKSIQIQILQNKVWYLQKQLKQLIQRERNLQSENQSLRLCASMSKRKLQVKDSQLKEIKFKERKKKYVQKLFQLSSEEQFN